MKVMKIVHVTRSLVANSGVSVFVSRMANAMAKAGQEVSVRYTWFPELPVDDAVDSCSFKSLGELSFRPDAVHIHGLWSLDMVRAMSWCRKRGIKYFVSPHGGLMPRVLRRGWLKKHLFYWMFLRSNLNASAGIHCTGEGEVHAVQALGIKARMFIVPLGCDIPDVEFGRRKEKKVLFLSRLGEEKGLIYLLEAWNELRHDGWHLVLAGPDWEGYRRVLEKKIESEKILDVQLFGTADPMQRDALYRSAKLFVLPSPMENFSMVVLDALAYGLPVICTKGCPWKVIEESMCGWWIESNSCKALADALRGAMDKSENELISMGKRSRMVARLYSWGQLSKQLIGEYQKD